MEPPENARRRWFGLFFLILAGGMLIWGLTLLNRYLDGVSYLLYWSLCFLLTLLAFAIAWTDLRAVRRRAKKQRRRLLHETLDTVHEDAEQAHHEPRHD